MMHNAMNFVGSKASLKIRILWIVLGCLLCTIEVNADEIVLFREEFQDLASWEPHYFQNIQRHTTYEVQIRDSETFLAADSNNSASALVSKQAFNIVEYPILRWRWKIDNIYTKGNYRTKSGDDYPIRVYVFFAYDPQTASLGMKIKYGLARAILGRYPPLRCLNYIWANRKEETDVIASPFTDQSIMIPLQQGSQRIGQWVEESVNLLADYRDAFGEEPPPKASLAIMSDSDNTGERATAYIQFIEVSKSES